MTPLTAPGMYPSRFNCSWMAAIGPDADGAGTATFFAGAVSEPATIAPRNATTSIPVREPHPSRAPLMLRVLRGIVRAVFILLVVAALGIGGFVGLTLAHFNRGLPDYQQLAGYVPATGTKIYAGDGSFITEFESEHRIPMAIAKVPPLVIHAVLAAEDRDFYNHRG